MLSLLFSNVVRMSVTASVAIAVVLLARLLLKRAPKIISYVLWIVVLFRLLCPVSIPSAMSVFGTLPLPQNSAQSVTPQQPETVQPIAPQIELHTAGHPQTEQPAQPQQKETVPIAAWIWLAGVIGMMGFSAASYVHLRKLLVGAVHLQDRVFAADHIQSPFVLGILRPRIYLPSDLDAAQQEYILLHEQCHIQRLDSFWKLLAFFALCIHWFNPLVWAAFMLAGRDMEMSCDEAVIRKLGPENRALYAETLLNLATGRRRIAGTPLAFGEGDPKGRIQNLAKWKRPTVWVVMTAVVVCAFLAVVLGTDPEQAKPNVSTAESDSMESDEYQAEGERPMKEIPSNGQEYVDTVLNSLTITGDGRVNLMLPAINPFDLLNAEQLEQKQILLRVMVNSKYYQGEGTYGVETMLDDTCTVDQLPQGLEGWKADGSWQGQLNFSKGSFDGLTVYVELSTEGEPPAGQKELYIHNAIELTARDYQPNGDPDWITSVQTQDSLASLEIQNDRVVQLNVQSAAGTQNTITLELPEGCEIKEGADQGTAPSEDIPEFQLVKKGEPIGRLCLYPLGTDQPEELAQIRPEENKLPMQIFAITALSNHAGYEEYQVQTFQKTGAAATAQFWWQDLQVHSDLSAVEVPIQQTPCILAYDWKKSPVFVEIILAKDVLSQQEYLQMAASIRFE